MSTPLPASLRRILAAQKPKPALPDSLRRVLEARRIEPTEPTDSTIIWADGETWRRSASGPWRLLRPSNS